MGSRRRSRRVVGSIVAIAALGVNASAQTIVRVDVANDGSETAGLVDFVDVSDDGTKVVFSTDADGLDPADVNGARDVLLRDLVAGTTTLVSVRTTGKQPVNDSGRPRISGDGRFVAFESLGVLVSDDTNGLSDVYLRDVAAGTTTRVSVASDGTEADGESTPAAISGDGNRVLFRSSATNLVAGDTNGTIDLFLRDVAAGTTIRVSDAADGTEGDGWVQGGDLSRDGQVVLVMSSSDNLVPGDANTTVDVFVHDLAAGTVVRASVDSNGNELVAGGGNYYVAGGGNALSPDGKLVAFATYDENVAPQDENDAFDVFLRDLAAGTTTPVSVDSQGRFSPSKYSGNFIGTYATGISQDARFVLMEGAALALAPKEDGNPNITDVYVRDRALAMTTRQSNGPDGASGNWTSFGSRMSADGLHVAFVSGASDLVPGHPTSGACAFLLTRPLRAAASSSYGSGLAGSLGVPTLGVAAPPLLNQPLDLQVSSSTGGWTAALLLIGTQSAQIPTRLGGDLLVVPLWTALVAVAPAGFDLFTEVPPDERFAAFDLYLQALEIDAGAPHGVSFTAGLDLQAGF